MRQRALSAGLAATALVLAFAVTACDLIGSLTPFGLGDRGDESSSGTFSGGWSGPTSTDGEVTFAVTNQEVVDFVLTHLPAPGSGCTVTERFEFTDPIPILNGEFSARRNLDPQGSITIRGRFTAPEAATGTYAFSGLTAAGSCPTTGQGSFTATKAVSAN